MDVLRRTILHVMLLFAGKEIRGGLISASRRGMLITHSSYRIVQECKEHIVLDVVYWGKLLLSSSQNEWERLMKRVLCCSSLQSLSPNAILDSLRVRAQEMSSQNALRAHCHGDCHR